VLGLPLPSETASSDCDSAGVHPSAGKASGGGRILAAAARSLQLLLDGMHRTWGAGFTKRMLASASETHKAALIRGAAHSAAKVACAVLRLPAAPELAAAQVAACGLLCQLLTNVAETDVRSVAGGLGGAAALLLLASGVALPSLQSGDAGGSSA